MRTSKVLCTRYNDHTLSDLTYSRAETKMLFQMISQNLQWFKKSSHLYFQIKKEKNI
jgi:hypothetical protein